MRHKEVSVFVSGEGFAQALTKGRNIDLPIPVGKSLSVATVQWQRSEIIRNQALQMAGYKCEIDTVHTSFIPEKCHHQYMEGHHAIPMHFQPRFSNSLDVYANIVCLCPVCHKQIHYGARSDRESMMKNIYEKRCSRLVSSGLILSKDEFISIIN